MAEQIRSSFIPKKTLVEKGPRVRKRGAGLYMLASVAIFVISAVLGAGVFFYEGILEGNIERKATSLQRAQEAFEPALIRELSRLSDRIDSSKGILDNHVALSSFFEHLENITLQTVRFSDFSFTEVSGKTSLSMSGEAESFSSIALQDQRFGESDFILDPIFSNLSLDASGNVTFDFTAGLDKGVVSFKENLSAVPADNLEP